MESIFNLGCGFVNREIIQYKQKNSNEISPAERCKTRTMKKYDRGMAEYLKLEYKRY